MYNKCVMKDLPPISLVVPTLNEEKYLSVLLGSLCELDHEMEVIIVDAHSDDKTVEVVESFREKLNRSGKPLTMLNSEVRFIAKQRNQGAQAAKYDILLFCDADIKAPSTEELRKMLQKFVDGNYVIATSRIAALDGTPNMGRRLTIAYYAQRVMSWIGRAMASGNFILTTKEVFEKVGGFDETLRISEDVDYSLRAAKHGKFTLFSVPIRVSTRRAQKYGYRWLKENPKAVWTLFTKGKLTEKDNVFYPFGEF